MKFKRALLTQPGKFILADVEETPGPGEVQIKVASCGLCNWELNHWKGYIVKPSGYPFPLGHEFAGTVVAVGANVTKFQIGDKISGLGCTGTFVLNGETIGFNQHDFILFGTQGILKLPDPNAFGGEVQLIRGRDDVQILENTLPYKENSRGIGPAEMAEAIRHLSANRAGAELALHVLDVIECMVQSTKTGGFVRVTSTCDRPTIL